MARIEQGFFDRTQAVDNSGKYTTAELMYFVFDVEDEDSAIDFAMANTPSTFNGMPRDGIEVGERINESTFKVTAQYKESSTSGIPSSEEAPDPVYSFDTSGGTQHITQSINTVKTYPADAENYGGAIGYDGENIEGVDIVMPVFNFSEKHYMPDSKLTTAYKKGVARITGTINAKPFRGYNFGEVLFLGASGSKSGDDTDSLWEITFNFAISLTREDFKVGDIDVDWKYGWDYMWVRYADKIDDDKKTLLKKPKAVYMEVVYKESDFGALGIGN